MGKSILILIAILCIGAPLASVHAQGTPSPAASPSSGSMQGLANRLPGGANAVLLINVEKFVASPLGKAEDLQAKLMSGYADRPLAVPANARRVAVGAAVHPVGLRSIWEAAVIEVQGTPRLEPMLRAQGGYLDKIEGRPAAWTPRDAYYITLDDKTLGVARPAQRQLIRMWLMGKDRPSLSPYITGAVGTAGDADAVFAIDLQDAIAAAALRYAYGMGRFPSLEKIGDGPSEDKLIQALASVRGMSIAMRATDKIAAQWIIDFDQPVAALGDQVEPFLVEVLTAADLYEPGVEEQWQFKVDGKRIVGTGTMQLAGLNKLIGLFSPMHVGDAEATTKEPEAAPAASGTPPPAAADGRAPASANPQQSAAQASQSYYRAVSKKLDMMAGKPSPQQGATWLLAQARQIEQLPLVGVDPELAEWGASIANAFYRAAQELSVGQQRAQIASERIASPTASTAWTESGTGTSDTAESRAAYRNAQKQRREAAQVERSAAVERAFNVFNEILPTRAKIRAAMVQRYGVEF